MFLDAIRGKGKKGKKKREDKPKPVENKQEHTEKQNVKAVEKKIEIIEKKIESIENELKDAISKDELKVIKSKLENLDKQVDKIEDMDKRMKEKYEVVESAERKLGKTIEAVDKQIDKFEKQIDKIIEIIEKTKDSVERVIKENAELRKDIDHIKKENEKILEDHSEIKTWYKDLKSRGKELDDLIEKYKKEIEMFTQEVADTKTMVKELTERVAKSETDIRSDMYGLNQALKDELKKDLSKKMLMMYDDVIKAAKKNLAKAYFAVLMYALTLIRHEKNYDVLLSQLQYVESLVYSLKHEGLIDKYVQKQILSAYEGIKAKYEKDPKMEKLFDVAIKRILIIMEKLHSNETESFPTF